MDTATATAARGDLLAVRDSSSLVHSAEREERGERREMRGRGRGRGRDKNSGCLVFKDVRI
jgi:hypothetical protein